MAEEKKEIDDISRLIAAINPEKFSVPKNFTSPRKISEFKKDRDKDFWKAFNSLGEYNLNPDCPEEHKIIYDSSTETLEPVYFWILDKTNEIAGKTEKLIDNFASSPGSGHFSEMGMKATKMQEESMKIMQTIGILVKSLVNIIYDLREFKIRISQYESAESKDKNEAEAGLLALKQIWMDNVDIKRGRGSINMLAQDLQFVTLRDSFMAAKSVSDIKNMDLNDRVKRILEPRILEFMKWKEISFSELKKRFSIEKSYLKNQVESLKMYTRWVKPYLRAASQLEMTNMKDPALVTAFNTMILQLSIMGTRAVDVYESAAANKEISMSLRDVKLKREYSSCVLVDLKFRGIPQRAGQNFVFGGKAEATFRAYALNADELKMLRSKLEESDLKEAMRFAEGMTTDSLEHLKEDIDYFLEDKEGEKEEKKKIKSSNDVNPFRSLFGLDKKKDDKEEDKKDDKEEDNKIRSDNYVEKVIRELAQKKANESCFAIFDVYKKAHDMASHPSPYD